MGGWLYTATPYQCAGCPAVAVVHGRSRLCGSCELAAYDRRMSREFPQWYQPWGPRLRALAATRARGEAVPC